MIWAIVVAGGRGQRFGGEMPKQYLGLRDRSVLEWSCLPFLQHPAVAGLVVVLPAGDDHGPALLRRLSADKQLLQVSGGAERAESVCAGLRAIIAEAGPDSWALVHDAARPCLHPDSLTTLINSLKTHAVGGLLAVPARDTLKRARIDSGGVEVCETLDRREIWQAQTPQMFRAGVLLAAYESALAAGLVPTDEAAAVEQQGLVPQLIEGRPDNLKITTPADLRLADFLLQERYS